MRIEYRTGDLCRAEETFVAHGCNAQGKFESGVAGAIRREHRAAYEAYMRAYETRDRSLRELPLGLVIPSRSDGKTIFNCVTQRFYGRDPKVVYVSYDAIATVFRKLDERLGRVGGTPRLAMPLIGAGLANGSWETISTIVEEEARSFQPVVYLIDGVKPAT